MPSQIVQFEDVRKTYQMGVVTVDALRGVSLEIQAGEYVTIMGPSGCGKSTMLNLLGCLDRPTSGRYHLGAEDVSQLDDDALSAIRGARLTTAISPTGSSALRRATSTGSCPSADTTTRISPDTTTNISSPGSPCSAITSPSA